MSKPSSGDAEVEVTWEDQKKINSFGKLSLKKNELLLEKSTIQEEITTLKDAIDELILADDFVKYQVGSTFIELEKEEVERRLNEREEGLNNRQTEITEHVQSIEKTLAQLKVELYAKFGSSINLEER
eukprot:TRINITY_DN1341_c0_g1_i1.p2 TRINITY_DN1341_c0_g1~~TRINITY_DN1341_c0_g1_i1.p2  ORF type:complete len:128 (-),score=34.76 TRINITY_DN1341_c0_g1_i1:896-1279(-)